MEVDPRKDESLDGDKEAAITVGHSAVDEGVHMPESLRGLSDEELLAIEKRVKLKADRIIMPIIAVLYILNYIDRQNLSAAKLQGILTELNMTTKQFATAVSILFVGYLPFQIPSNLFISRIKRPGMYITIMVTIWGTISACTAAVHSYQALLGVRVLLGVAEAVFFPGVMYKKGELGTRIGVLYIGQQVGNAFGGLIAAGCLKLTNVHGISAWRWLFIIEGSATVGLGLIFSIFMPEFPHNARMLTPIERDMAVWRIEREAGDAEGTEATGTWAGFVEGFKDPKLYVMIFCNGLGQVQGSIANFFPTILASLGYNSIDTLLLTAPPYVFAAIFYCFMLYWSDRKNWLYPMIIGCLFIAIVVYIIPMATSSVGARYFSMMLMPCSSVGPQLILYKTVNQHMPRPVAKRAAAIALVNAIGGTSNIWMSYLWVGAPHFYKAFGMLIGASVIFAFTATCYRFYVRRENAKLASGDPDKLRSAMRFGITQQQVDMGWRYEGW
ncbi:hypothetical protein Q5752_000213 [Cryptotrichosporon argae]